MACSQGPPRPPIILTKDGIPAERQPRWKNDGGLHPHRSQIATLQLYAGGEVAFVFRGEALKRALGLRWLRHQHLISHSAGFETAMLMRHAPHKLLRRHRRNGRRS